jgi:hypothetical protein
MSDIDKVKELGRVAERLSSDKDFQTLWDEYTIQLPLETVKYFEGDSGQIDTLMGIRQFREWFENLIENAKKLKDK